MGTLTLQKVNKLLLNEWEEWKFQTKESPAELPAHQSIPALDGEGNIFVHMPIINALCIDYCLEIKMKFFLATLG